MQEKIQDFLHFLDSEKGYADNTIAAYRNDLTQFLRYLEGQNEDSRQSTWAEIDKDTIIKYILNLKEREYTSSTVARKVAAIKSFFHYLMAEGGVKDDPTATLDSPKVKKRLPKAISREDIERLLTAPAKGASAKSQRDHALLELLYASGMRVTELVSLDVDDMDLASRSVRVRGKKASSKERVIPIGDRPLDALQTYLNKGRMQLVRDPEERALFLNHRGQRLTVAHYQALRGRGRNLRRRDSSYSAAFLRRSQAESGQITAGYPEIAGARQHLHHSSLSTRRPGDR
jgi:integrase/recombinase XerD